MTRSNDPTRGRPGFTLVELMIVLVIIGILAAILLPAIQGAIGNARNAAVMTEEQNLGQALASFKNTYGDYPPSRVILCENAFYDTSSPNLLNSPPSSWYANDSSGPAPAYTAASTGYDDLSYGQLASRSLYYLRKFWPRAQAQQSSGGAISSAFQSSTGVALTGTPYLWPDFNGNGVFDANPIPLQGPECLAFFLGGIPDPTSSATSFTNGGAMTGFSRSPLAPFVNNTPAVYTNPTMNTASATRATPVYEFRGERLVDDDHDGMPGYIDSLGASSSDHTPYYAYFSAYGNGGYDPNDYNSFYENDTTSTPPSYILTHFRTTFNGTTGGSSPTVSNNVVSPSPNPYTSSLSFPGGVTPALYMNPQTFQIISPGRDRVYGFGGQYDANANAQRLPFNSSLMSGSYDGETLSNRAYENDNLTNFSGGRLN